MCDSPFCVPVAHFPFNDSRKPALTALHICQMCGSAHFQHPPREGSTIGWHQRVYERNTSWSIGLFEALSAHLVVSGVVDIGCGIGTWLNHCKSRGVKTIGFDTSATCIDYGRKEFELNLRCEYFTKDNKYALDAGVNLVTCIMVMEHLSSPKALAYEISEFCKKSGSMAYVSVPFFNEKKHIDFDSESLAYSVFNDVGAHVSYFTDCGMELMFSSLGLSLVEKIRCGGWRGFLFR